jgi:hypothetical protein
VHWLYHKQYILSGHVGKLITCAGRTEPARRRYIICLNKRRITGNCSSTIGIMAKLGAGLKQKMGLYFWQRQKGFPFTTASNRTSDRRIQWSRWLVPPGSGGWDKRAGSNDVHLPSTYAEGKNAWI